MWHLSICGHWFGEVVGSQRSMVDWGVCLPWVYVHSSICDTDLVFSVVVFQRSMVNWGVVYICHGYMCILLYVTLIWCSGVPEIYAQLGGMSAMGICAFFDMWHWFGVVVFQRSMVNWGVCLPWVYVHSSICDTDLCISVVVFQRSMVNGEGGLSAMGICAFFYMWHWFGVVVFQRSMVNWGRGTSAMGICAFCYMWHWFSVVVFQRSMLNWGEGVCLPWVYGILPYVTLIWCISVVVF